MRLATRTDLLTIIDATKAATSISDSDLCRRAGLSVNAICNLRTMPKRSMQMNSVVALVEACGYRLETVEGPSRPPGRPKALSKPPTPPKPPVDSAERSKAQQRRRERERAVELEQAKAAQLAADRVLVNRLHRQIIDLRTGIQHRRHHDDLLSEIDDILYDLKGTL